MGVCSRCGQQATGSLCMACGGAQVQQKRQIALLDHQTVRPDPQPRRAIAVADKAQVRCSLLAPNIAIQPLAQHAGKLDELRWRKMECD